MKSKDATFRFGRGGGGEDLRLQCKCYSDESCTVRLWFSSAEMETVGNFTEPVSVLYCLCFL